MVMFVRILPKREKPEEFERLAQVAEQKLSRKEDESQDHAVYDLIKSTSIFKAKIQALDLEKSNIVHDKNIYRYGART